MADHRVVVIGGGFGGLYCARALRRVAGIEVTLIDRRNFHLFQPLLYQVATGGLSPANIAAPLRAILKRSCNIRTLLAEVTGSDPARKLVLTRTGEPVPYDTLVLATGSSHHYFGHADWEQHAPGLKSIEDATEIRRRVLSAFERAERSTDATERKRLLTFVVIGGGPTGVEMAGTIAELARVTMRRDFRSIDPTSARVVLIEGQPRVLPTFHEKLSAKALTQLSDLGVEVHLDCHVVAVAADQIAFKPDAGKADEERIDTECVVWAAGVRASPLGKLLAESLGSGIEVDRGGRVAVGPDCSVPGHPDVFVIGDLALFREDGKPLPGLAPVAMQQGDYVAGVIRRRVAGKEPPRPFHYVDKGTMATIGRSRAVADIHLFKLSGFLAWLAWLFVHILYLARFENRVLVIFQWFFNYVTRNRAARLITNYREPDPPAPRG
jgi:NADH dehydrogenase